MTRLLMTRPADANQRFVSQVPKELLTSLRIVYSPLISIEPAVGRVDITLVSGVVFTSSNAVRLASIMTERRTTAYCVGEVTASLARSLGWAATCLGQNADELVTSVLNQVLTGNLVHIHGEHARGEISGRLSAAGVPCASKVIYRQLLLPLSTEASELLRSGRHFFVPLFSPRAAAHFADTCPNDAHLTIIAMSQAVADSMPRLQSAACHVIKSPTVSCMMLRLKELIAEKSQLGVPGTSE